MVVVAAPVAVPAEEDTTVVPAVDPMAVPVAVPGGSYGSISQPVYATPTYGYSGMTPGAVYGGGTPIDSGYVNPGYSLGEIPIDGGYIDQSGAPGALQNVSPGSGSVIQGNGDLQVPPPGPDNDSTRISNPSKNSAVLTLNVPEDAKVYINDKLTRTDGESRSYVSRNLKPNRKYQYLVKAVVVRDGKDVVRTQMVTIKTGETKSLAMDFDAARVTSLALNVPQDAKVILCGKETSIAGTSRYFETSKLEEGMTWKDYTVQVSVERNGKVISRKETIDMLAGESYSLSFDFDNSANQKVAAK